MSRRIEELFEGDRREKGELSELEDRTVIRWGALDALF